MRLIDADEALSRVKPYEASDEEWAVTGGTAIRLIHNAIDNAPTIDAMPVVRCKDCEHCQKTGGYFCLIWGREVQRVQALDFCSYGERMKEDNKDAAN